MRDMSPPTHKLYDVLGLSQSASRDEIKRAYKKYAVQHHPDKGGDEEKFKEVASAYEVLSDEDKRRQYDSLGDAGFAANGGGGAASHFDPRDIFQQFFGGAGFGDPFGGMFGATDPRRGRGGPQRRRCADHPHAISVSLAEAYHGVTKTIRVTIHKTCEACRASCFACQGVGTVAYMTRMGPFTQVATKVCETCKGRGVTTKGCDACHRKGQRTEEHRIELVVPPGVDAGHRVVLPGLGEQPTREGDVAGDVVVDVLVGADRVFQRNGADLHMSIPISFIDSVTGTTVVVPHFAGEFTVATSDLGIIQPNVPYKIAKKGMPRPKGHGDLILTFVVKYPAAPSADQRAAIRAALITGGLGL